MHLGPGIGAIVLEGTTSHIDVWTPGIFGKRQSPMHPGFFHAS